MKKYVLMLLCSMALMTLSCSSDDNGPGKVALVTKITTTSEQDGLTRDYTLAYDSQKRITQIVMTGDDDGIFLYYYNEKGQLSSIITSVIDPQLEVLFKYDEDGRLASFEVQGQDPKIITYNEATDLYTVENLEFSYNEFGDVDLYTGQEFNYETAKKGPFANSPISYHLLSSIPDGIFILTGSKKPINYVTGANGADENMYDMVNTYNDAGYITKAEITGSTELTIEYEYTDL